MAEAGTAGACDGSGGDGVFKLLHGGHITVVYFREISNKKDVLKLHSSTSPPFAIINPKLVRHESILLIFFWEDRNVCADPDSQCSASGDCR